MSVVFCVYKTPRLNTPIHANGSSFCNGNLLTFGALYDILERELNNRKENKVKLSDKAKERIRIAYNVLISLSLVVTGVLFACQCYSIYKSGTSPFTRESIAEAYSRIAVSVYITISLILIGLGLHIAMPEEKTKLKGLRTPGVLVKSLADRIDYAKIPCEMSEKIEEQRKLRKILTYVRIALVILVATLPLIYLLNPANFPAVSGEYNAEILHGMLVYLAFIAPLAIYEVAYVIVSDTSLCKEYEFLKEAVKLVGKTDVTVEEPVSVIGKIKEYFKENEKALIFVLRVAVIEFAVGFIIIGVINGGMADVLAKAIKICTECIGLG